MPPDGDAVPGGCVGGGSAVRVFTPAAARGWLARSVVGFGGKGGARTARGSSASGAHGHLGHVTTLLPSGSETQARQAELGWVVGWMGMDGSRLVLAPSVGVCYLSAASASASGRAAAGTTAQRLQGLEKE